MWGATYIEEGATTNSPEGANNKENIRIVTRNNAKELLDIAIEKVGESLTWRTHSPPINPSRGTLNSAECFQGRSRIANVMLGITVSPTHSPII